MADLWQSLGDIRWPLLVSMLVVVALVLWSARRLSGANGAADARTKVWIDAILFWGAFALITGILGTLIGIISAAHAIELAGEVQPSLLWSGIRIALLSSAAGGVILALACLAWFGLQLRWRMLAARFVANAPR